MGGILGFVAYKYNPPLDKAEKRADDNPEIDIHDWKEADQHYLNWSLRGMSNFGALTVLITALLTLFAGYTVFSYSTRKPILFFK
jgi:hypothetical protein